MILRQELVMQENDAKIQELGVLAEEVYEHNDPQKGESKYVIDFRGTQGNEF